MFLNILNEDEKILFLEMALTVAAANDVLEETEVLMLEQYCKEMDIAPFEKPQIRSLDEIITAFKDSTETSKHIAVLELLGLGHSDGSFDKTEDSSIKDFALGIGLSEELYNTLSHDIDSYVTILNDIEAHVFTE